MNTVSFSAKGKLLLTGEYAVLDGAQALAVPTRQGQQLSIAPSEGTGLLSWSSTDMAGHEWFFAKFELAHFDLKSTNNEAVATRLQTVLRACRHLQPRFLPAEESSCTAHISADFPLNWGLGSSSTLIALMAKWSAANPYALLDQTFGGSGYDIACAFADGPIVYQKPAEGYGEDRFRAVAFDPPFSAQLYFVYLGKKQDSREGIGRYRALASPQNQTLIQRINALTQATLDCTNLSDFEAILTEHEYLIAQTLQLPRVQETLFSDYPGTIKSLGAWGGDFVLATSPFSPEATQLFFKQRGFDTCIAYRAMV